MQSISRQKRAKIKKIAAINIALVILIAVTGIIVMNVSVFQSANPVPDKVILVTSGVPQYFAGAQPGHSGADAPLTNEQVGLSVFDNSLVWQTNTLVNIFEHNDPRVKSDGTGKAHYVIAPGTSNRYIFTLRNDKEKPIRYQLRIEGGNDSQYTIPVNLKILDPYGKSMLGDDPILIKDMEDIVRMGSIKGNGEEYYTVEWEWVFENGTDPYDTFLGDTAVTEEIPCHLNISVIAEYDDPGPDDSVPASSQPSGESSPGSSSQPSGESSPGSAPQSVPSADEPSRGEPQPSDISSSVLTGDHPGSVILLASAALIIAAVMLAAALIFKRKKHHRL